MAYMLVLFGHRKEKHQGEYAPEVLEAIDQYTNDENPSWILERKEIHENTGNFQSLKIIEMDYDEDDVYDLLLPKVVNLRVKKDDFLEEDRGC